jgi:heat shock protein HtpX
MAACRHSPSGAVNVMGALTMENTRPEDRHAENRSRLVALTAGFFALVFVLVTVITLLLTFWITPFIAPIVGLVVAAAWVAISWKSARSAVLDLSDVEPADERRHARLFNAAAALSATTGVQPPEMYIVDDPAINAMAAGTNAREAAVVVTSGLLDNLEVVEIEAVLALIFFRIKSDQIVPETFAVPTIGVSAVLAEQLDNIAWLQRLLFAPMPLIERVLMWLHPADSEFEIDIASTLINRYPPALASALEKMIGRSALAMGTAVTAHLWLAPPVNVATQPESAGVHKPLRERVAVLQEL